MLKLYPTKERHSLCSLSILPDGNVLISIIKEMHFLPEMCILNYSDDISVEWTPVQKDNYSSILVSYKILVSNNLWGSKELATQSFILVMSMS